MSNKMSKRSENPIIDTDEWVQQLKEDGASEKQALAAANAVEMFVSKILVTVEEFKKSFQKIMGFAPPANATTAVLLETAIAAARTDQLSPEEVHNLFHEAFEQALVPIDESRAS